MTTKNFFKVFMPYGIKGNIKIGWTLFNRNKLPIGATNLDYFTFHKFEKIDKAFLVKLGNLGCTIQENMKSHVDGVETNVTEIYFYSNETIPINTYPDEELNKMRWERYSEVVRLVSIAMNV